MAVRLGRTAAFAVALLAACAPSPHQGATATPVAAGSHIPTPASAAEIVRIDLARAPVMGDRGPSYSLDFSDSGRATRWEGRDGNPQMRKFSAPLDTATFRRMAQRAIDDGFFRWGTDQRFYGTGPVLALTIRLTRYRQHGVAGRSGVHMALGAALDSIASTLTWTPDTVPAPPSP